MLEASKADWAEVEPAIFGTLLESALNPLERHDLGAHYTPRAYVDRLVLPTVIEPLRADWRDTQAAALLLANEDKLKDAADLVRTWHHKLCTTRVLDPACGSGNFLYVTLEHMKRLEGEVLDTLAHLGDTQQRLEVDGLSVDPHQFLGLEINPRAAEWPPADYIVGNPPYIGAAIMRQSLGDGYTESLRAAWPDVPEFADFVVYWWHHAAGLTRQGQAKRFGFITTSSLTQTFNRRVLEHHLNGEPPLVLAWAIPDHPWVDAASGAAVRIAMTVGQPGDALGLLQKVVEEGGTDTDAVHIELAEKTGRIHPDLTVGADVAVAIKLVANQDIANRRERFGDWEADLVIGAGHQHALVTINERTSRYVLIARVPAKTAQHVSDAILSLLTPFSDCVHTLTTDNGKEFAQHERIAKQLDAGFFFAHPYASWERGANENMNGLIREFFPKKLRFDSITHKEVALAMQRLNHRPQKCLDFRTPHEVFAKQLHQRHNIVALQC